MCLLGASCSRLELSLLSHVSVELCRRDAWEHELAGACAGFAVEHRNTEVV